MFSSGSSLTAGAGAGRLWRQALDRTDERLPSVKLWRLAPDIDRAGGRRDQAGRLAPEPDARQDTTGRTERLAQTRGCGRRRAEPELAACRAEPRAWQTVDNTIRRHQALGYLTPVE